MEEIRQAKSMSRSIPMPLRAAVGLASVAIDNARQLPHQLVALPVRTASTAMQVSLRIQQHYVGLVNRGDQLLNQISGEKSDQPSWAEFDDDTSVDSASSSDQPTDALPV